MFVKKYSSCVCMCILLSIRLYAMGVPEPALGVASVTAALGAPLKILLTAVEAARQGCEILKSIHDCLSDMTGSSVTTRNINPPRRSYHEEEEKLRKNPALQATEQSRLEKALGLLLTISSPRAHFCERIEALFTLNTMKLLGLNGCTFEKIVRVINSHYFSFDGKIRHTNLQPVPCTELVGFLRALCPLNENFQAHLKQGLDLGIEGLADCQSIKPPVLNPLAQNAVSPFLIISKKTNRYFMKVIHYCKKNEFLAAHELIERHRTRHDGHLCRPYDVMKHYYTLMLTMSTR